jgi:uncharacterized cofD-like protein
MQIVTIGGGNGQSRLLAGLRVEMTYATLVAIPSVADNGRSTGRLRKLSGIAVGDLRRCLTALATKREIARLWEYRLNGESYELSGHLGNYNLAALLADHAQNGIEIAHLVLGCCGSVVPPTFAPVMLVAECNGKTVRGQSEISWGVEPGTTITNIRLESDGAVVEPNNYALRAIESADIIIIGPGALFGSILPVLKVPGVTETLLQARGQKLFICNLASFLPESVGFIARDYVERLTEATSPELIDLVVYDQSQTKEIDYSVPNVVADIVDGDPRYHNGLKLAQCIKRITETEGGELLGENRVFERAVCVG